MSENEDESEEEYEAAGRRITDFGKRIVETALDRELGVAEFISGLSWALYRFAEAQGKVDEYRERFLRVYEAHAEIYEAKRRKFN